MNSDRATYRVHRALGVEHIRATYRRHRFPPHVHRDYLIGLTLGGVEDFSQDGHQYRSRAGQIRTINPDVAHDGGCLPDLDWQYEALYVPRALMREAAEVVGVRDRRPRLTGPVLSEPFLAASLGAVFRRLRDDAEPLASAEELAGFLCLFARRCIADTSECEPGFETMAVRRARDYLEAHALTGVRLESLADVASLSKFHLLRVFKSQTGLTPWQYQTQARIDVARAMLARGEPPGQVAAACGFVDQSHLTRIFRRVVGVTPAAYAADCRRSFAALPGRPL